MKKVKQKFLQSHILQSDHQGFFKDIEVRLIDKTQASEERILIDENIQNFNIESVY